MKHTKKVFVVLLALLLALLPLTACGETTEGLLDEEITITVKVTHKDLSEKVFEITTRQPTLLAALQEKGLVEGDDQQTSFYITTVDGELADWSVDEGWWSISKGGVSLMTGAETTLIADGEVYEFTYKIGF